MQGGMGKCHHFLRQHIRRRISTRKFVSFLFLFGYFRMKWMFFKFLIRREKTSWQLFEINFGLFVKRIFPGDHENR